MSHNGNEATEPQLATVDGLVEFLDTKIKFYAEALDRDPEDEYTEGKLDGYRLVQKILLKAKFDLP